MSFCCAFVLLVGLARARCPSKFAYVRRAFYSYRRAPGDMRAKKASSVLASFRRGDTYDHIRRARQGVALLPEFGATLAASVRAGSGFRFSIWNSLVSE